MEQRKTIKNNIDNRLSAIYKETEINGERFFLSKNGIPFRTCTMAPNMIVVEYADTWEDGDVFYTDDMTEEDIFMAMLAEIDG